MPSACHHELLAHEEFLRWKWVTQERQCTQVVWPNPKVLYVSDGLLWSAVSS